MNDTSKRQPPGIPAGGQFASHDRADGETVLDAKGAQVAFSLPGSPDDVFYGVQSGTWNGFPAPAFDFDTAVRVAALVNSSEDNDPSRLIEIRPDGFYEGGELLTAPTADGLYTFDGFMWVNAEAEDGEPGNCPRCGSWDDDLSARDGICETCYLEGDD